MADSVDGAAGAPAGTPQDPQLLAELYAACSAAAEPASEQRDNDFSEDAARRARRAAVRLAREEAEELGGTPPDPVAAALLELLAHAAGATSAVYIGEAPGIVALSLLAGMRPGGTVTAITSDPHHAQAGKRAVAAARYPSNACRFISTRPIEVLGKLATGSYDLVVAQQGALAEDILATRGLELAGNGSVVVLGTASAFPTVDPLPTASDSATQDSAEPGSSAGGAAAGGAIATARVHRLPLGGGVTVLYAVD